MYLRSLLDDSLMPWTFSCSTSCACLPLGEDVQSSPRSSPKGDLKAFLIENSPKNQVPQINWEETFLFYYWRVSTWSCDFFYMAVCLPTFFHFSGVIWCYTVSLHYLHYSTITSYSVYDHISACMNPHGRVPCHVLFCLLPSLSYNIVLQPFLYRTPTRVHMTMSSILVNPYSVWLVI